MSTRAWISGAGPKSGSPPHSLLCASLFTSLRLSLLRCTSGIRKATTEGPYEDYMRGRGGPHGTYSTF